MAKRVIEELLGKTAEDEQSDLDETHVERLCHLLRGQGGDHGRALADKLIEPAPAPAAPAPAPQA